MAFHVRERVRLVIACSGRPLQTITSIAIFFMKVAISSSSALAGQRVVISLSKADQ